jgi:hypothetical protein
MFLPEKIRLKLPHTVSFTPESNLDCISEVSIWHSEGAKSVKVGTATSIKRTLKIKGSCKVGTGVNSFQLRFNGKAGATCWRHSKLAVSEFRMTAAIFIGYT